MDQPELTATRIVRHPETERECLVGRDGSGNRVAFAFEVEGEAPGLSLVDPALWLEEAADDEPPELGPRRFDVVAEAWADDYLPALVADPVGSEWLARIKAEHPEQYHAWFAQCAYETGGEEGSG